MRIELRNCLQQIIAYTDEIFMYRKFIVQIKNSFFFFEKFVVKIVESNIENQRKYERASSKCDCSCVYAKILQK